jgi:hypothetical protein
MTEPNEMRDMANMVGLHMLEPQTPEPLAFALRAAANRVEALEAEVRQLQVDRDRLREAYDRMVERNEKFRAVNTTAWYSRFFPKRSHD